MPQLASRDRDAITRNTAYQENTSTSLSLSVILSHTHTHTHAHATILTILQYHIPPKVSVNLDQMLQENFQKFLINSKNLCVCVCQWHNKNPKCALYEVEMTPVEAGVWLRY